MEFMTARDLRINTSQLWQTLEKEKELVITLNGKPVALLSGISGASLEPILAAIRKARGEWAIRKMQQHAVENGLDKLTLEEINEEIKKTRKERHRGQRRKDQSRH